MEAQIEKAIKLRKQANFKILTRLAQIIECSPHLRFQQILSNYKVCKLAVSYDEELAKSPRKSFITNDTPSNTELELKFNIVKEIITDKLKEKADRETAKNKAAEKARLTELLAKKQSEKLESLSEDEIKRRLAELG